MATTRGRYPDLNITFHGAEPDGDEPVDPVELKALVDWWTEEVLPWSGVECLHQRGEDQFGEDLWQTTIRTNATKKDVERLVRRLGRLTKTYTVVIASDEVRDRQARWGILPGQRLAEMDFETGPVA